MKNRFKIFVIALLACIVSGDVSASDKSAPAHAISGRIETLMAVSPMDFSPDAWEPYATCLVRKSMDDSLTIETAQGYPISPMTSLDIYLRDFENAGNHLSADTLDRIDQRVVAPCLRHNPYIANDDTSQAPATEPMVSMTGDIRPSH